MGNINLTGYTHKIRLLEEEVEHYYEIVPGEKRKELFVSFRDSLNRYYPIGYMTEIDTEAMCLVC